MGVFSDIGDFYGNVGRSFSNIVEGAGKVMKPGSPAWGYSDIPALALGGLALGAGLRGGKHMLTSMSKDEAAIKEDPSSMPVTNLPMKVTPEEAAELERQGVRVKKVLKKRASLHKASGLGESMAVGGSALAASLGGWYLTDKLLSSYRKRQARQKLEETRGRIRSLLEETPDVGDQPLFNQMKAAEARILKSATWGEAIVDAVSGSIPTWFSVPLGVAAGISGLSAYHASSERNKLLSKLKAIKRMMKSREVTSPTVGLEPVVEIEERPRNQEEAVNPSVGAVVATSESPAAQAAKPGSI